MGEFNLSLSQLWRLLQFVAKYGNNTLVRRWLENLAAGTPTKIDDVLVKVMFSLLGFIPTTGDLPLGLTEESALEHVQAVYDTDPVLAKSAAPLPINAADPYAPGGLGEG